MEEERTLGKPRFEKWKEKFIKNMIRRSNNNNNNNKCETKGNVEFKMK